MSAGTMEQPQGALCTAGHYFVRLVSGIWGCQHCPKLHLTR